jgi:hypothetical protein
MFFCYNITGVGKGGRGCIYIVQYNKKFSRQNLDFVTVGKFNCYTFGGIRYHITKPLYDFVKKQAILGNILYSNRM